MVNGLIDQVRIYNYIRTPAQIAWEYNRGAPVAWYKFDECSGTTANDSGSGGNNGTITIGGTGDNDATGTCSDGDSSHAWNNGTIGKRNASINLDGSNDYVVISDPGSNSILDFASGDSITVSAWVYPEAHDPGGYSVVVTKGSTLNNDTINYSLVYTDAGHLTFGYHRSSDSGWMRGRVDGIITLGEWQHIAATYTFGTSSVSIYHNGKLYNNDVNTTGDAPTVQNEAIWIGADDYLGGTTPDELVNGNVDEVKVFNYVLTDEQIRDDYNSGAVHFGP